MDGDKSGESGAFLFSRRVPDFCDGRRSFPTNENSNLYRRGRRRWISLITNPPNCWVPVSLSRKFQFLAHFPFPAKFIARIRGRIVAIGRYIWDGRQKLKAGPDRLGFSRHMKTRLQSDVYGKRPTSDFS